MEIGETQEEEGKQSIGSVKGALSRLYKERNFGEKTELMRKTQLPFFDEKPPWDTRELHFLKKDIVQFNKNRKTADSLRAKAELELVNAKKTVKDLTAQIEKSNLNAKATKNEVQMLRKSKRHIEKSTLDVVGYEKYDEVMMNELETVKQELSKLKLNMAWVLETKLQAEKEIEASVSKVSSCSSSIETLNEEIEKANEEQVLVELARIEAVKEFASIKAQREVEAAQFSTNMERIKKRIHSITRELKRANKLEAELAVTTSDVGVLQNELMLVKAMEMRNVGIKCEEESETSSLLKSVNDELKGKKKELESIRREAYQCMASMDIIREEIKRVSKETSRSKKIVSKADSTVANLNSKLVRANSKLEAVSSAEKKARAIVANLSAPLEHLRSDADEVKKEKEMINEELVRIIEEKEKYESETDLCEGKLKAVMEELEAVKASEARALENLRIVAESTVRSRESKSKHTSSITISKFEYAYLSGCAKEAVEIAYKKVLAAKAWLKAIKVEEKEIVLMTGMSNRELLRLLKEEEGNMTKNSKKAIDLSELDEERQEKGIDMEDSKLQVEVDLPRKSVKESGNSTPARRAKSTNARRPSSPGGRHLIQSGSILLRKRRKAMPILSKLFHSSKIDM